MLVTCRQTAGPRGIWATVGCVHNLVTCGSHVLVQVFESNNLCMRPRKLVGPKLPVDPHCRELNQKAAEGQAAEPGMANLPTLTHPSLLVPAAQGLQQNQATQLLSALCQALRLQWILGAELEFQVHFLCGLTSSG